MIHLGINMMVWSGHFGEREFPLLRQLRAWGYETVEVPIFDFVGLDPLPMRHAVADSGLALTVSSALPASLSLISADRNTRRDTRSWLQRAVEKVSTVGGAVLAGPMYHPVGALAGRRRTISEWNWAVDEYRTLGSAIRGSGVRIAVEPLNRFETYFLNTAEDGRRFCEQVGEDSIGVLFDTFHANIEEESVTRAIDIVDRWMVHVHLSENNRGIPGSGHVPFRAVARVLRDRGYSGHAVVESFASSISEIAAATAMWRDYAVSPDEFARRSIENMRPLFDLRCVLPNVYRTQNGNPG